MAFVPALLGKPALQDEQVVEEGTIKLQSGALLPRSTYRSEFLRLKKEAQASDFAGSDQWIDRRIAGRIKNLYGKRCFDCAEAIPLELNASPLIRAPDPDHRPAEHPDFFAFFHADCWVDYQRCKQNKRRRLKYAAEKEPQQQPRGGGGLPLAIQNSQVAIAGAAQPAPPIQMVVDGDCGIKSKPAQSEAGDDIAEESTAASHSQEGAHGGGGDTDVDDESY